MLAVGELVAGRYEVIGAPGAHPLGRLYPARDRTGTPLLLHLLDAALTDEATRASLSTRLGRARAFAQPELARLEDVLVLPGGEVMLALAARPGPTLAARIAERRAAGQRPPFGLGELRSFVTRLGAAVAHAHQHGVVLGDLQAATVLDTGDLLQVTNVGVATLVPRARLLEAMRDTPGFRRLAPELRSGLHGDARADVYALAALICDLATGEPPPRGVAPVIAGASPALGALLGRALADDPLLRPSSVEALALDLDAMLSDNPPLRRRTPSGVELRHDGGAAAPARPVPEVEIDLLRGADEVTRQISEAELFPLRLQSSRTDPFERLPTDAARLPRPNEPRPSEPRPSERGGEPGLFALEAQRTDETPPTLRPVPPADARDARGPRVAAIEVRELPVHVSGNPTPVPPMAAVNAPPERPLYAEDDEESQPTHALGGPPVTLPRRAREPFVAAPATPPASSSAPPRRRNPFDPLPDEAPAGAPMPKHLPTLPVPPLAPPRPYGGQPRRSRSWIVLLIIVVIAVAVAAWRYLDALNARAEKQRLAAELNRRADELRRRAAGDPAAAERNGPCAVGAVAVSAGGYPFCVDVYEYPGKGLLPRTLVSLAEATSLCKARGARLCSESEWERACRGKGGASFPYGQAFEASRCNVKGPLATGGSYAACKSAAGAFDMSGSVAEWVASGALKGGAVGGGAHDTRCSATARPPSGDGAALVGFRCCSDPAPEHP